MRLGSRLGRRIFVSYRRADTQEVAGQLYERLVEQFGATNVFMDRADIESGQRWRDELRCHISDADMFIALIGRVWLATLKSRAADDDVLRTELTSALESGKQVIPVLVDGASMPLAAELPQEMRGLADFQALPIDSSDLDRAMLNLLGRVKPGWRLAVSWAFGQLFGWGAGLTILIATLAGYGWLEGTASSAFAAKFPFAAGALAGVLAGACIAAPQWLLLRSWFGRARFLMLADVILTAIASGYAGTVRGDQTSQMFLGLLVVLLPVVFAVILWWVVSEKLVYAGWWTTANLVGPLAAVLVSAGARSTDEAATANTAVPGLGQAFGVLASFFVPMVVTSLAAGILLVWLMRRSEVKRR